MESVEKTKLAVYYWTNVVSNNQGSKLEQQKNEFSNWLANQSRSLEVSCEFVDSYLKKSKPKHFPELAKAVDYCVTHHAKLVIVKLNGLINQEEFSNLLATPNLDFVCVDKQLSVVRQYVSQQSKQHSANIKKGLKLTNRRLGNPNAANAILPFNKIKTENSVFFALLLEPIIAEYVQKGYSQRKMVNELNQAGILAPEGGKWVLSQLQKVLKRVAVNNAALDLSTEIEKRNYRGYSASDLISALNESNYKSPSQPNEAWTEHLLNTSKERHQTIDAVIELYDFMQRVAAKVHNDVTQGQSLDDIANHLNKDSYSVPRALLPTSYHSAPHAPTQWNAKCIEELLKRLDNRLQLSYDAIAQETLLKALREYNTNKDTYAAKVYSNPVLISVIRENK